MPNLQIYGNTQYSKTLRIHLYGDRNLVSEQVRYKTPHILILGDCYIVYERVQGPQLFGPPI